MGDENDLQHMDPREFQGKTYMIEDEEQFVPEFSKWNHVCSCCCGKCNMVYFPAIKRYFCNQWECNPLYPCIVTIFISVSFAFALWGIIDFYTGGAMIAMITVTSFVYVVWIFAYYEAVCSSPGYLPFYWAVDKRQEYTLEQQWDGVVTNQKQFDFAAYNGRPERGSFSVQARRLVLKADHICKWISNWVGLKNYRYFFTMVIWMLLYFIMFFADFIAVMVKMHNWQTRASVIGLIICAAPALGFSGFAIVIFRRHVRYLCRNTTTLQQFKVKKLKDKHNYYDLGCCRNIVEVMGPAKYCPIWFCPIPYHREWNGFTWEKNAEPKDDDEA
ncbi:DHHC zinc finger domain containing protein [Histomonas meleagridis]|uniref:DHHC zinc finger domain containing protein n=1 Tax=Histomonas meleagridis TaxID=135588 RepID=UPI003559AB08|nr:DHHC zinc finger domain containing protein [Histomonas meleagridis]KAH0797874.1 DHHC zinc finger domain containing protein [Histomonas meleagridis]